MESTSAHIGREIHVINIGDDITVNARVIEVEGEVLIVRLKSGDLKTINVADVNTHRPCTKWDGIDHRKGN